MSGESGGPERPAGALESAEPSIEPSSPLAELLRGAESDFLASPLADGDRLWAGVEAGIEAGEQLVDFARDELAPEAAVAVRAALTRSPHLRHELACVEELALPGGLCEQLFDPPQTGGAGAWDALQAAIASEAPDEATAAAAPHMAETADAAAADRELSARVEALAEHGVARIDMDALWDRVTDGVFALDHLDQHAAGALAAEPEATVSGAVRRSPWLQSQLAERKGAARAGSGEVSGEALLAHLLGESEPAEAQRIERALASSPALAAEAKRLAADLRAIEAACEYEVSALAEAHAWIRLQTELESRGELRRSRFADTPPPGAARASAKAEAAPPVAPGPSAPREPEPEPRGAARSPRAGAAEGKRGAAASDVGLTAAPVAAPDSVPASTRRAAPAAPPAPAVRATPAGRSWGLRAAAALLIALGAVLAWRGEPAAQQVALSSGSLTLAVEAPDGGETRELLELAAARALAPGSRLIAGPQGGRLRLFGAAAVSATSGQAAPDLGTITLAAGSELRFLGDGRWRLVEGRLLLDEPARATSRTQVAIGGLRCRLIGTAVAIQRAVDGGVKVEVLEGQVALEDAAGGWGGGAITLAAGHGVALPSGMAVGDGVPFTVDAERARERWRIEPLRGGLEIVAKPGAGQRYLVRLQISNRSDRQVRLLSAGALRRCWLQVSRDGGRPQRLALHLGEDVETRLAPGATHVYEVEVGAPFSVPGTYHVRARYLVGRASEDGAPAGHYVTAGPYVLRVADASPERGADERDPGAVAPPEQPVK